MRPLQLKLLGQFECSLGKDERIALPMRKAEVLLAYLAIAPGLRHPRERLINLLWSDRSDEQARNSLRQCLSAIKKSLGDAADLILLVDRTTVCLKAELIEVDAHEFERLAAEGDYESLATAASLYLGEFLEGISIRDAACQEWLDSERNRFNRQFIEILTNLAETQLVTHDFSHAIKSAERLVEQDPLGESGWRMLMRSYFEHGDRSHALQAFKRCQKALHDELDVEPENATVELRDEIAGGETKPKPAPVIPESRPDPTDSSDHSIAVLPFDNLSGDPEQEYFSDGITESIILNLGSFSGINVKSRHASFAFKDSARSIDEIANELGVQYIVEGSIRKFGDKLRITAQLADTTSGNQVWGKRYDYDLEDLFTLEEELSLTIAGTVSGRVDKESQLGAMRKPARDLKSYDYLLRANHHVERFTAKEISTGVELFKKCLELDPENATAHASLGSTYMVQLYENCAEDRAQTRKLMLQHLERALELDPGDALTHSYLAEALHLSKDFERGVVHARKAVELNPTLADGHAILSLFASANRQYDEAIKYADLSMQIDPFHPWIGWNAGEIYRNTEDYERAIDTFRALPHLSVSVHAQIAACLAGLGRLDEAREEMRHYLVLASEQMISIPAGKAEWYRFWEETMPYKFKEDTDRYCDLLMQAGLCDDLDEATDQVPSIAVLPFENMSGDLEQEHFADGITTDIIATLSKFKHMRTVARYSILQYKDQKTSIADIAEQQHVHYILEGSVRKSGERIRVSAELIDSKTDQVCWSERFDRDLDDLFAVQDEITLNIALAMKVQLDDGEMAVHRSKGATSIQAWELTLAATDLQETYIRQNILEARDMVNEAIRLDPDYAYAWITLGWTYWQEAYSGWTDSIEELIEEAVKANQHAMSLDPNYGEAWIQAGMNHQMKHESEEAIAACLRAVELEPGSAEVHALTAFAYIVNGDYKEARKYEQNMLNLCPIRPNWYYLVSGGIEKKCGNLDLAIEIFQQGLDVEPDAPLCRFFLIDALMEKGDETRARQLAEEIRTLDNSVTGKGLVHCNSYDARERQRFHDNLAKFGLV